MHLCKVLKVGVHVEVGVAAGLEKVLRVGELVALDLLVNKSNNRGQVVDGTHLLHFDQSFVRHYCKAWCPQVHLCFRLCH